MTVAAAPWSMVVFHAMSSSCRIIAPTSEQAEWGQHLVLEFEQRWSRFRTTSEISALNEAAGRLCVVSPVTYELVALAERAREVTDGAFNPLVLEQLIALGYDRSWESMTDHLDEAPPCRAVSREPIELFPELSAVRLPSGTRFDPGGIGKGLAGDMVTAALLANGAQSVQIELGGDVRLAGQAWEGGRWSVHLDDSAHRRPDAATISLDAGGVATSSVSRRRWRRGDVDVHHLIDPSTGNPAATDLETVTAVAPDLWWAEVVAKVALMSGSRRARAVFRRYGMSGVLISSDEHASRHVIEAPGAA